MDIVAMRQAVQAETLQNAVHGAVSAAIGSATHSLAFTYMPGRSSGLKHPIALHASIDRIRRDRSLTHTSQKCLPHRHTPSQGQLFRAAFRMIPGLSEAIPKRSRSKALRASEAQTWFIAGSPICRRTA